MRWISVENRLPKDLPNKSERVLACKPCRDGWNLYVAIYYKDEGWFSYPDDRLINPTHWMPLSDPPKSESGDL